jgi:hypothetical protein
MPGVLTGPEQLKAHFSALTEQTFQIEFGVADPLLIDYLSNLLVRFIRVDAIFRLRDIVGRRLEEVADMLMEAERCEDRPPRSIAISAISRCSGPEFIRKPSNASAGLTAKMP